MFPTQRGPYSKTQPESVSSLWTSATKPRGASFLHATSSSLALFAPPLVSSSSHPLRSSLSISPLSAPCTSLLSGVWSAQTLLSVGPPYEAFPPALVTLAQSDRYEFPFQLGSATRFRHPLLCLSLFLNDCVYDSVPNIHCPSFSSSALSKGRRNGIHNNAILPAMS